MIAAMEVIFGICIGLGLLIPFLSAVFGYFGALLDLEFDFVDDISVDTGGAIPLNLMCVCFSLVVFGALGHLFARFLTSVLALVILLIVLFAVSFGAYSLIYRYIIRPLKKNNPRASQHIDFLGSKGKLTLRITAGCPGTVSLFDSTGAPITYRADTTAETLKIWDGSVPQGTEVLVVGTDEASNTLYVKPLNTFENHRKRII